jgi:DNA-damage-inducible protein J
MSTIVDVKIPLDREDKKYAESLFENLGMNLATAVNVFVRQSIRMGRLPFDVADPFYSAENQSRLQQSIAQLKTGQIVEKTMEELEALEDA